MHIIIGHKAGSELRNRNLFFTIEYYRYHFPKDKILIVEQKTKTNLSKYPGLQYLHLSTDFEQYNRSLGFNEGYRKTDSEILFFTDNDFLIDKNFIPKLDEQIDKYDMLIPYNYFWMLNEEETKEFVNFGPDFNPSRGRPRHGANRTFGGAMIIKRSAYEKVGGYDEDFLGWGGEDDMFYMVAQKEISIGRPNNNDVKMYHLNHERFDYVANKEKNYMNNLAKVLDYKSWNISNKEKYRNKLVENLKITKFRDSKVVTI